MPEDARINGLLEEVLAAGRAPEEVCRDCPELLPVVRQRLVQLHAMRAELGDLFPTPHPTTVPGTERALPAAPVPPQFPGYEIQGELGRGGMGVVYRAYDRARGREVALKALPGLDPSALYRFKQEFRALAGVSHPNLVSLHELVSDGRQWFFTMEYIEGVNFLRHVREGGAENLPRLQGALRQLAQGLSALHAAGKLHRDLKQSNVLVDPSGRVVLLDFGLAAELDSAGQYHSTERHVLGTAAYMAPEQAAGLPVSPASDWYSFGVMLYEALAGRLPFAGGAFQVLRDKQERDPPPPHELAQDASDDLALLCMELLRRDPKTRPTGKEVLLRLGESGDGGTQVGGPPPSYPAGRTPLIGRKRELETLREAFQELKRGRTVAVLARGQSGVGKTALVQHFLDEAAEEGGAVVLAGRCYEQESVPYKALDSLIDSLARCMGRLPVADARELLPRDVLHLARVFPVLRRVEAVACAPARATQWADPHEARRRAAAALRELLARLGDRRPLVLFIDDLQWGDIDSAGLLADLLRPPDPPVLLLVGAYRSEDAASSPFLQAFLGQQDRAAAARSLKNLEITPLSASEARDLALTLLGRTDPDTCGRAEALARESGGSPFFVYELVQHLHAGAGVEGGALSEVALDRVLWGRIERLPAEARRLLETAAVAGRPLRRSAAGRAAGVAAADAALAPLRSGRLIRVRDEQIDVYHDRVRETVLAHLAADDLANRHGRLAEVLEVEGGTDPEVLGVHFHGAGLAEPAARCYAAAAEVAAQALAFDHAAGLWRRALQLSHAGGGDEQRLRTRLADALANAGLGAEAAREYLAAAAGAAGAEALDLQRRASLQLLVSGHVDEGIGTLRPVLAAAGMKLHATPFRALLALLFRRVQLWLRGVGFRERAVAEAVPEELERIDVCWSVTLGLLMIDPIRSAPFTTRGLLLALRAGEPSRIARALAIEGAHTATAGRWAKGYGMRLLGVAGELARRLGHPYALGMATFMEGGAACMEGSWKAGQESCDRAEQIFREHCVGVAWELDSVRVFSLWSLHSMGKIAELGRRCHAMIQEARKRGNLYVLASIQTFNLAVVRLAEDDPEGGRRELEEAVGRWSQRGYHIQHHNALLGRVLIELYAGNPGAAWEQVTKNWPAFWNSLLGQIQNARIHMMQMRAYSALALAMTGSDPGPLLPVAERMARLLRRESYPWPDALSRYIRVAAAFRRGDPAAYKQLAEAAEAFEAVDMRLHAASCRRRLGRLVGGAEGQALVEQADTWMAGQGIRNPARMTAVFAPGFPD